MLFASIFGYITIDTFDKFLHGAQEKLNYRYFDYSYLSSKQLLQATEANSNERADSLVDGALFGGEVSALGGAFYGCEMGAFGGALFSRSGASL